MRMHNRQRLLWSLLVLLLGSAVFPPSSFADSKQMEDRDRSVDWALGGLEQGSRITRSAGQQAPAGSKTTPGSKVSPSDTGANRTSRVTAQPAGAAVSSTATVGSSASGTSAGTSGQSGVGTSQPPSGNQGTATEGTSGGTVTGSGGGSTSVNVNLDTQTKVETGSGSVESGGGINLGTGTGTGSSGGETASGGGTTTGGETTPGGQTPSAGETTDSGLNIHVEADTSSGNLGAGAQTETTDTSLDVATGVETGTETGTDLSGQVDAEASTDTSATTLVGSAELTSPGTIDTSTTTELESNLSGGANDASPESDSTEAAVGDNADDCSVAGLISCPSIL